MGGSLDRTLVEPKGLELKNAADAERREVFMNEGFGAAACDSIGDFARLRPGRQLRQRVLDRQRDLLDRIRSIPEDGILVRYDTEPAMGANGEHAGEVQLQVLPRVFIPLDESLALTRNFVVKPGDRVLDVGTGAGVIAITAAYSGARLVVGLDISPDCVRCAKGNVSRHGFGDIIDIR